MYIIVFSVQIAWPVYNIYIYILYICTSVHIITLHYNGAFASVHAPTYLAAAAEQLPQEPGQFFATKELFEQ